MDQIKEKPLEIITLLVNKNYDELMKITESQRLSSCEINNAIENYGENLVTPPKNFFKFVD